MNTSLTNEQKNKTGNTRLKNRIDKLRVKGCCVFFKYLIFIYLKKIHEKKCIDF